MLQLPFEPLRDLVELIARPSIGPWPQAWPAQPQAPGLKQQSLQLPQAPCLRAVHRQAQGTEPGFQGRQDVVTFRDQTALQLQGRKHAGGHTLKEPGLLAAVAAHRDLANSVGNPLELQPEPYLLAVGAPGVVIPIKRDLHALGRLSEQPQRRLGVGRPLHPVGFRCSEGLELGPAQGRCDRRWLGHAGHWKSIPS